MIFIWLYFDQIHTLSSPLTPPGSTSHPFPTSLPLYVYIKYTGSSQCHPHRHRSVGLSTVTGALLVKRMVFPPTPAVFSLSPAALGCPPTALQVVHYLVSFSFHPISISSPSQVTLACSNCFVLFVHSICWNLRTLPRDIECYYYLLRVSE